MCVCLVGLQNTTNVSAGSTAAMRMRCASTWLEATAAPASLATQATELCAKVGKGALTKSTTGLMIIWRAVVELNEQICISLWKCRMMPVYHRNQSSVRKLQCVFLF